MIGRFGRTARGWARRGAALTLLALLLALTENASAKPYTLDPGPLNEGDPTADDQPSPTPKKSSRFVIGGSTASTSVSGTSSTFRRYLMTWDLYLRILSRMTLR